MRAGVVAGCGRPSGATVCTCCLRVRGALGTGNHLTRAKKCCVAQRGEGGGGSVSEVLEKDSRSPSAHSLDAAYVCVPSSVRLRWRVFRRWSVLAFNERNRQRATAEERGVKVHGARGDRPTESDTHATRTNCFRQGRCWLAGRPHHSQPQRPWRCQH